MRPRRLVAASAASLLLALSACGGDRPSTNEVSDALQEGGAYSDEAADCFAEALDDTDVSDAALRALVDQDADYEAGGDDATAFTEAAGACVDEMMADVPGQAELEERLDDLEDQLGDVELPDTDQLEDELGDVEIPDLPNAS